MVEEVLFLYLFTNRFQFSSKSLPSLKRGRPTALLTFFPILHILGAIYSDDGKEYAPLLTQRDAGRWKAFQSGAEGDPGAPGLNGK